MSDEDFRRLLDETASRQQIMQVCHRYCRALDRVDEELLRSVFHPDSVHHHDVYQGSSSDFCGYAIALLGQLERTQHHLGNVLVEVSGDVATSEAYFMAYHRLAAGVSGPGMFAREDTSDAADIFVGGRYVDRFERRNGEWRIAFRTGLHDWETWQPASERYLPHMTPAGRGRRDRNDPAYLIAASLPG
jgi:hypothetical protein